MVCDGEITRSKIPGLIQCENCGFITTDLSLSAEEIKKMYSQDYYHGEEYADYIADKEIIQKNFKKRLRTVQKYLENPEKKNPFEIGCAYGFFLQVAAQTFQKVAGFDISDEEVQYAQKQLKQEAYAGDFLENRINEKYHIVCLWDTIEHLEKPELYIEKANEMLEDQGLICITTGDISSLNARVRGEKWRQIHPPTHLHYFSKYTLHMLLERKGFRVLETSYPANALSMNTVLYTLLCRKSNHEWLYNLFNNIGITKWNININLHDFMFVIA